MVREGGAGVVREGDILVIGTFNDVFMYYWQGKF